MSIIQPHFKFMCRNLKWYICFWTVQTKLAAAAKAHLKEEDQLKQQFQQLPGEIASLRDEKKKLAKKIEQLDDQMKHS